MGSVDADANQLGDMVRRVVPSDIGHVNLARHSPSKKEYIHHHRESSDLFDSHRSLSGISHCGLACMTWEVLEEKQKRFK